MGPIVTDLAAGLKGIGFRVLRQREIAEPFLFADTQDGAIFARGGRLARCRQQWRFSDRRTCWIEGRSLTELRAHVPWLPAAAALHPVLRALRTGWALRLRGLATRDLTLVVESWRFSGPFAAAEHDDEAAPASGAAGPAGSGACRNDSGVDPAPVAVSPARWYLEPDAGPPHDRSYLNLVLAEHEAVLGCERGRPAPPWDPLATGLGLLGRLPPGLPAPRSLRSSCGDRLATLLSKVIRLQGLRLASCLDGVRYDRHPEYVHDARVATRRARFALRVASFNGQQQADELRDRLSMLARLIGPVRDLDVLLPRLGALAAAARSDLAGNGGGLARAGDGAQQRLAAVLRARRAERVARVQEQLPDTALARLPELLSRWGSAGVRDAPVETVAAAAIRTAMARVTGSGRAVVRPGGAPVSDLHRLRLRLKRLRYTAELFVDALPRRRAKRALATIVERCAAAQTALGELNDDAVAGVEIRAIQPQLERRDGAPAGGAPVLLARAMLQVLECRQRAAARRFGERWPRLRERLQDAVAEL